MLSLICVYTRWKVITQDQISAFIRQVHAPNEWNNDVNCIIVQMEED